jgi:hypothetical protein
MKKKKKTPENCISIRMHTTELSSVAGEMDWRAAKEEAQKREVVAILNPRNGARSQVSPLPGQYLSIHPIPPHCPCPSDLQSMIELAACRPNPSLLNPRLYKLSKAFFTDTKILPS